MTTPGLAHRSPRPGWGVGRDVAPGPFWLTLLTAVVAWACTVPVLRAVMSDADRGLDMMDESHYLMAAQPWASDKAFNGVFGWYSGRMLRLVGDDLARLRLLAAVILLLAALVLARALRRAAETLAGDLWPGWLRGVWPPAVVSAAMCYYTVFVRTPSYNWFAAVGLMLLAAGLLRAVAGPLDLAAQTLAAGGLFAAGAFVTAIGKATTALGATVAALLALVVHLVATDAARRRALAAVAGWAALVGVLLAAMHVLLINSLSFTLQTYRRVSQMLAIVDPGHYAPGAAVGSAVAGTRDVLVDRPSDYLVLLLLPLVILVVPWLDARRPGWWLSAAQVVTFVVPLVAIVRTYPGGVPGLGMSVPPLVIAAEAGVLVAAVAALWWQFGVRLAGRLGDGGAGTIARPWSALLLAVALLAMGAAYPLGTNVEYATQLHGGFPVLLVAGAVGVCCIPNAGRLVSLAVLAAGAIVLGAVLVPTTRDLAPYRIATLDQQTIPRSIVPGTPPVLVEVDAAQWIDDLRTAARFGGFKPGTPMLDLTWHPASVLVLDGRAPRVLLPDFPGWPNPGASAAFAMAQENPAVWRGAWLLVPIGQDDAIANEATSVVGKRFPADYSQVGTVVAPYDRQQQGLWKPRG